MARRGYVQLANGFYLNRKVRRLRRTMPSAISAFVIMLSYCGDNLTDGYVDADTAEFVLDVTPQELEALNDVGLIENVDDGWLIHDYLEHNRSRGQVMAKRAYDKKYTSRTRVVNESESESGQTPEHQNTRTPEPRTPKKDKEELHSSLSKEETNVNQYHDSPAYKDLTHTISREYRNLDIPSAWDAFQNHHYGEDRHVADWSRLWKGWCQRRATMSGIPPAKHHKHTWACEHTLNALKLKKREDVKDMDLAVKTANELNREEAAS